MIATLIQDGNYRIEFIGEVNGKTFKFDPFVSSHLEWFDARKWMHKDITFIGFIGGGDNDVYLISEVVKVV